MEKDLALIAVAIGTLERMRDDICRIAEFSETDINQVWQGYPIEEWITDLKLRINITQVQAKQTRLAKLEQQLNSLLSEDQRRELALAAIEAEMG